MSDAIARSEGIPLWGAAFEYDAMQESPLRFTETLVPLTSVQTTESQRAAANFDEAGYQSVLEACRNANPGCGEPLIVLESNGAPVTGRAGGGVMQTVDLASLANAGVLPEGRLSHAYREYERYCESRDLETISRSDAVLFDARNTTLGVLLQEYHEAERDKLACMNADGELDDETYAAADRQSIRTYARLSASAVCEMSIGEAFGEISRSRDRDRYTALSITPETVGGIVSEEYPHFDRTALETIALDAAENLSRSEAAAELVRDQVWAEADGFSEAVGLRVGDRVVDPSGDELVVHDIMPGEGFPPSAPLTYDYRVDELGKACGPQSPSAVAEQARKAAARRSGEEPPARSAARKAN